jgi:hypothetical protein
MTLFNPNLMQRSLLLLALAASFVGCKTVAKNAPVASAAAAPEATRFSWQKDTLQADAAPDATRVSVKSLRADLSLLELSAIEKRDPGAKLQLTKAGHNFIVEIIKADDKSAVVSIVPGQISVPEVRAGDELGFAVLAQ